MVRGLGATASWSTTISTPRVSRTIATGLSLCEASGILGGEDGLSAFLDLDDDSVGGESLVLPEAGLDLTPEAEVGE